MNVRNSLFQSIIQFCNRRNRSNLSRGRNTYFDAVVNNLTVGLLSLASRVYNTKANIYCGSISIFIELFTGFCGYGTILYFAVQCCVVITCTNACRILSTFSIDDGIGDVNCTHRLLGSAVGIITRTNTCTVCATLCSHSGTRDINCRARLGCFTAYTATANTCRRNTSLYVCDCGVGNVYSHTNVVTSSDARCL